VTYVGEHIFTPHVDEPWGRCQICGLAAPAHDEVSDPYVPIGPYRCSDCVMTGRKSCPHYHRARRGEL
jgi:hypothetical protein